jgi:hypothetical protein
MRSLVPLLLPLLALAASACGPPRHAPAPWFAQDGVQQRFYDSQGRLQRVLEDRDGNGVAEVVIIMDASGQPERAERDLDGDGTIDRIDLMSRGQVQRVGPRPVTEQDGFSVSRLD